MPVISAAAAGGQNRVAFLAMITHSEIGAELMALTDGGYDCLVGATPQNPLTFPSYADHPDIFNAACNSDAAGAFQIMHHWWPAYKASLNLPDFSPLSQDLYALQQIRECHALPLIDGGNFVAAVAACNHIWASLTGSPYGQHTNAIDALQDAYVAAGGVVATA